MTAIAVFIFIVVFSIKNSWNMQVIFERAYMGSVNEKYATDAKIYVRRYERRGDYYLNLMGTTKHTWANNVSVNFVFYEYLHNEYKQSFIEYRSKMCDFLNHGKYIAKALVAAGLRCPMPPGKWSLSNISVPVHDFPNVFPFEKCRFDARVETVPEKEHIFTVQVYLRIKQTVGK